MLTTRRDTLAILAAFAVSLTGAGSSLLADHCGVFHCCPDCGHKQCCPTPTTLNTCFIALLPPRSKAIVKQCPSQRRTLGRHWLSVMILDIFTV